MVGAAANGQPASPAAEPVIARRAIPLMRSPLSFQRPAATHLLVHNDLPQSGVCSVAARGRPAARGMASAMIPCQTPDASLGRVERRARGRLHCARQRVATATGRGGRLSLTHFMPPRSLLAAPRSCARELASCHGHTTQQFSLSWPWPTTVKPPEAGSMITLHLTRFRIYPTPICAPLALHKAGPLL